MNNAQQLYFEDPLLLEFDTFARQVLPLPDGRWEVILSRSYFYPTGGGQEHDTGLLDDARVVDVFKRDEYVIHVVDREIPRGPVKGQIDVSRRRRHMQHHTGQHLLSQCFIRALNLETVSANINGDTPSTLDLAVKDSTAADVDAAALVRVEDLANQVIYEDRPVKTYFVTPEGLLSVPLRRPPKVTEDIRIVEIEDFDYSACGATHCLRTGAIGGIKILKAERQNDRLRISFVAGERALQLFRECYDTVTQLAAHMSLHPQELAVAVMRQAEQLRLAQRELQALRLQMATVEARQLADAAQPIGTARLVTVAFQERSMVELRALADEWKKMPGLVGLAASFDGKKLSLIVVCSHESGLDARQVLNRFLGGIGGRGGGDATLAQGGGAASCEQFDVFFSDAATQIRSLLNQAAGRPFS